MRATQKMARKELSQVGDDTLLTAQQVASKLQVSLRWVYRQALAGVIPYMRIGGMFRFRLSEIEKWLDSQKPHGARR